MKKNTSYRDQLFELSKLYKIDEIKDYIKSKKNLTTAQVELILLKNKIRLPEQGYNKKRITAIKFREQVFTNLVITICFITFVISLISVRPHIKNVTNEIKFSYVAQNYKTNFSDNNNFPDTTINKKKSKDLNNNEIISLDTQITLNLFDNLKYDLDGIRKGAEVKPIYLSRLPRDLGKIKSTKEKKEVFIKIVLPLVLEENKKIMEDRIKLFKILSKQVNSMGEKRWLKKKFKEYDVKNEDITELKLRIDTIPTSIAIAQAAKESGWGTSRFALEGNAMFGQWTWGKDGIEPNQKTKGQSHKVLKFPILLSSVKAYQKNLNTHKSYTQFRVNRGKLRDKDKNISGLDLVSYLESYAATGKDYVETLKKIIQQNSLTDFDNSTLINFNKSSSFNL